MPSSREELLAAYGEGRTKFAKLVADNWNLSYQSLAACDFFGARATGAVLSFAGLEKVSFENAQLDRARMDHARLDGANLSGASMRGALLASAELIDAQFSNADLASADLSHAVMFDADLRGANCIEADFRGTRGVVLNSTRVRGARFSHGILGLRAPDWIQLRDSYTGIRTTFHLLLLLVFFLPKLGSVFYWHTMNSVQDTAQRYQTTILRQLDETTERSPNVGPAVSAVRAALAQMTVCGQPKCREVSIVALLTESHKGGLAAASAILLLLYNTCRLALTFLVSSLRDEEESTGWTPKLQQYGELARIHRFVYLPIMFFAISSMLAHGWAVLRETVWIAS